MAFKVVIPQPVVEEGVNFLKDKGCDVVIGTGNTDPEYLKNLISDADALIVRTANYSADVLSAAKKLKAIGRFGVGLDNIDLDYCKEHNIMVSIAPGANSNSVAEHTIMFILMLARKAVIQDENTRNGNYEARNTIPGNDVFRKTLTVLGLGRIGRMVAQKAHDGLGMNIVAYDPFVSQDNAPDYVTMVTDFYEAVGMGDFVSIHMPATKEFENIINMKFFKAMKPTAYIINNARGSLQDEDDLVYALKNHIIAGAALDVSKDEPCVITDELWSIRENLIVSPHNAGLTVETKIVMAMLAAEGAWDALNGKLPKYPAPGFGK